jgi:hypothetical protein
VGADSSEHRQRKVSSVDVEAHGAGTKGESVAVLATLLEPGETDSATFESARSRRVPTPVGVGSAAHAVGEDLLRDLGPPDLTRILVDADGVLLSVPALT